MNPPFTAGDWVVLVEPFAHGLIEQEYMVQACKADDDCDSGWLVYIKEWKSPIDSSWFKKKNA